LIYAKSYAINASVIRLSNVFGPRASIHSSDFTFNNYFVGLAFQDRDITVYGKGEQLRNVIYVDDAVSAIIMASQNAKANGETFFAVGDEHFSVAQIAEATVQYIGSGRVKYIEWPKSRKAIEVGNAIISNKKIKEYLGWKPVDNLKNGLLKTKAFYEKCLAEYLR
jgi:UDP-glucose 4-epimerase